LLEVDVDLDSDIDMEGRGGVPGSVALFPAFSSSCFTGFSSLTSLGGVPGSGSVDLFFPAFLFVLSADTADSLAPLGSGGGVAHRDCLSFLGLGGVLGIASGSGSAGGGVGIRGGSAGKADVDAACCESAGPAPSTSAGVPST